LACDDQTPLVVEVKRGSLADGPGIRSVVFFKGCPLRCVFCHAPETQDRRPEIAFTAGKCLHCGRCARACPHGAIDLALPGRINRRRCLRCGQCVSACPGASLRRIGTVYPVEALAELLLRDLPYYRHSGGGVTLSGGECTLWPDYLESLLVRLKKEGVHVTVETSGHFEYPVFRKKVLSYLDLIFYDVKLADPENHRCTTGKDNALILENLQRLVAERQAPVHARVPLVPGLTATRRNLTAIAQILSGAGVQQVSLLPYNPMGIGMYEQLGRPRPDLPMEFMRPEDENRICAMFKDVLARKGQTTYSQH
jgi:pyruvate formate lyase activating enzyme